MSARPLLPQLPTDARVQIDSVEWLFAPDWPGRRLVADRDDSGVRLADGTGVAADDLGELTDLLDRAVIARRAAVDGVWLDGPSTDGEERRAGFVALDLVELDGDTLLDVPFQERHRLLESVVAESRAIRVSRVIKQPISGWLGGWREQGFTHYLAWHQNARYRPGERTDDWFRIPIVPEAADGGLMGRLFGVRRTRSRRIRD